MPFKLAKEVVKKAYEEDEKEKFIIPLWLRQTEHEEISFQDYYKRLQDQMELSKVKMKNKRRVAAMTNEEIIKQSEEIARLAAEQSKKK